ncbi:MAG: hypothetical protein NC418_06240 [Muribaculaceae bacterium]|nr:hypothetical protein [Muribaculaceae bacterium]
MNELNAALILRLLREEHLMKPGESDSFAVKLTFDWEMKIKREPEIYAPFKYALTGICVQASPIGTHASISRRFTTMEAALLYCLNGFNENARIPNKYASIEEALTLKH